MDFSKAIELVNKSNNIALFSHTRPDGDTIGCSISLFLSLKKLGKNVDIYCDSRPNRFEFLTGFEHFANPKLDSYDLAIAVDCSDMDRMAENSLVFKRIKKSISFDHHQTNNRFAELNFVDPSSSSTCEIVYKFIKELKVEIDLDIATALYLGLLTDTASFINKNTNQASFVVASELLRYGVDVNKVAYYAFNKTTLSKQKLIAKAINGIKLFADGKVAVITVFIKDLEELGLTQSDTESLIDYCRYIDDVEVGISLIQMGNEDFRVSFRSNGKVDVSKCANVFGGGGHPMASGCRLNGIYEDVVEKLVKSVRDRLE